MSDPAKSANEIEDVLASIRRLIGEANAPSAGTAATSPPPGAAGEGTEGAPSVAPASLPPAAGLAAPLGRLLLTPAFRVADPDDPWAPIPVQGHEQSGAALIDASDVADPAWDRGDRLADWGQIADRASPAASGSGAEAEPGPLAGGAGDGPEGAEFEAEAGDANWPDGSAGSALHALVLARGSERFPGEGDDAGETPAAADAGARAMQTTAARDRPAGATAGADAQGLTDGGMAGARAVESADGLPWTPARPEPGPVASDLPPAVTGAEGESEVGLLDEETLRDIIAEVVREELQGAMGQRITRNVRKMVRREIRLALAAGDLE